MSSNLFYPKKSLTKNLRKEFEQKTGSKNDEDFDNYVHALLEKFLITIDQKSKNEIEEN